MISYNTLTLLCSSSTVASTLLSNKKAVLSQREPRDAAKFGIHCPGGQMVLVLHYKTIKTNITVC